MWVLLFGFIFQSLTFGEYRVYELQIENPDNGKSRTIQSVLDQYQYPAYYPLQGTERIRYVRSWKCWGRSDYEKPLCPNPNDQLQQKTNSAPATSPPVTNP